MNLTEDPLAGIDADELEADIDKAIDELFVKKSEAPEPEAAEAASAEEPYAEPSEEPPPVTSDEPEVEYLVQLKENLLTLDWEISEKNIQSFENELQVVSDKVGEDRHSMATIKMALGVLQYLRVAKGSAAPISMQFLHTATDGLNLFGREPAPSDADCKQVMDKLLGQFRRVKAEIQRLKHIAAPAVEPDTEPVLSEEPVLEEIVEEEPVLLAEPLEEEIALEEIIEEEPISTELLGEEPLLEELIDEEPPPEQIFEEDTQFEGLTEEEPILQGLPEEEPALEEIVEEEPISTELLGEEPLLEELIDEEPPPEQIFEEDTQFEGLTEEEPILQGLPEEEPALQPSLEPLGTAFAPAAAPDGIPTSQQEITQTAKQQIRQLSSALESIGQETDNFFDRVMRAMADKPALEKVVRHFSSVYNNIEEKLADAREISRNVGGALTELEQSFGQEQMATLTPDDQAEIDSQINVIQDAAERASQAATHLRESLIGRTESPTPSAEVEPLVEAEPLAEAEPLVEAEPFAEAKSFEDMGVQTVELSIEAVGGRKLPGSEALLESVEETPHTAPDQTPPHTATIYFIDVANHTLGIPAEAVVNVFKVSTRKANALRQRGYARLSDFKAAFRSIKRGITGPLADVKARGLKKIQFPIITLSPEISGSDDTQTEAPVKGIVLLSNGERHGALFTDEIMQRIPYEAEGYRKAGLLGQVSGTAIIEEGFEVNVIDPECLLS